VGTQQLPFEISTQSVLLVANEELGLGGNAKEPKYICLSSQQNAGQIIT
jgi:hypothetical protein